MRSHSDDGIGLLGESTYEILSDSTILTEDEDDASSVHSFDGYSAADITSFDDSDSVNDYTSDSHEHPGIPRYGGLDELHVEDSDITVKEGCEAPRQIEFEEPPCKNGQVSVVRTLVEFNEQETTQILQHLRPENSSGRLICTLRQTMSQELLFLDEPFRLLYVGAPTTRDEIHKKIGGALAIPAMECASSTMSTDSKSSRFNVVPVTSFGTKSSPEVELIESFGVELAADTVTQVKSTKIQGKQDNISLCLNGTQWVNSIHGDNGITLEAFGWKLPHLAIIFCSEEDSLEMKQTRTLTRIFLGRHSVATLFITNKPHYHKPTENFALNIKGIHICLESRGANEGDIIVHKRLPVDLATFTSLDVRQMNRNFASITGLSKVASTDCIPLGKLDTSPADRLMQDLEKRPFAYSYDNLTQSLHWVRDRKFRDIWVVFVMGCLLLIAISGSAFSVAYMKLSRMPSPSTMRDVSERTSSLVPLATTAPSIADSSTSRSTPKAVVPSSTKSPASCITSVDLTSLLIEPTPLAVNDSQKFKIHIIGDNNIILRPPQKYVSLRKPPQLAVEVTRNGNVIETELSKLFDGVYTIVIPRDDAWGVMNVSVTTSSRPPVQQTFELDFGMPWFKFTSWRRFAHAQFVDLTKAAVQFSSGAKQKASELRQIALQRTHETHGVINDRLSEVSAEVKHFSGELSEKISKLYEELPLRFSWTMNLSSDYVRKAQRQAVNIWTRRSNSKKQD